MNERKSMHPTKFYKFRGVDADKVRTGKLNEDYSIKALLKAEAIFSSRKSFNDLFDSKIELMFPTPVQLLALTKKSDINTEGRKFLKSMVSNKKFTPKGTKFHTDFMKKINEKIDSYAFYCLTCNSTSNLLWAHYASDACGVLFGARISR